MPLDPALDPIFEQAAQQYNIDPALLKALALQETGGTGRTDLVSPKGAEGLMQLLPSSFPNIDRKNPTVAIPAAAKYLSGLLDKHQKAGPNAVPFALQEYNAGNDPSAWQPSYAAGVSRYYGQLNPSNNDGTGIIDATQQAGFGSKFGPLQGVNGFVVHHTAGGSNINDVLNTFKARGYPAQFVIDRQGQTYRTIPEGYQGQHIQRGSGAGDGLDNSNTQGVEIIAKDDSDVLPVQQQAAARLIGTQASRYGFDPRAQVFGHGEVNPGHRQASEGMSTVGRIRGGELPVPTFSNTAAPPAPGGAVQSSSQPHPVDAVTDDDLLAAFGGGKKQAAAPVAAQSIPAQPSPVDHLSDDDLLSAFAKQRSGTASTAQAPDPETAPSMAGMPKGAIRSAPLQAVDRQFPALEALDRNIGDPIITGARQGLKDVALSLHQGLNYVDQKIPALGALDRASGYGDPQNTVNRLTGERDLYNSQFGDSGLATAGRIGGNLLLAVPATEAALGAGGAVLGLGARATGSALPDLASVGDAIAANRLLGPLATGGRLAARGAAGGAVGGLTTESASDAPLSEQMRDNALLGAGVGVAAPIALRAGANVLTGIRNNIITPLAATVSQGSREAGAARNLLTASSDPGAVYNKLTGIADNPASAELVPGSPATTFQATADAGLGQAERGAARVYPEPFKAVEGQQNAARVEAVKGLAPETADPMAVRDVVHQHLARLDQEGEANIAAARQNADQAAAIAGGTLPRDAQGALMREQLEAAKSATKATESKLWQAIDPDGSLTIGTTPTSKAAVQIAKDIPQTAKPPEGEEAAIFDLAKGLPSTAPFQDFAALRGRLMQAIRDERVNGQTPALRRMQMLRESMDGTMSQGVADVANEQKQAVAAGAMSPDETLAAKMAAHATGYLSERNIKTPAALQRLAAGGERLGGDGAFADVTAGQSGISAVDGGQSQAGGRFGNAPGNPGLQGEAGLAPNFDTDAAARYRAAADATRTRAQTYNTGATGQVLQAGPAGTPYRVPDSTVAERFISSPEGVQSFLDAGGNRATLHDALIGDLRTAAARPDGTIDPRKLATWQAKRADALRAFPELQQQLSGVGPAQEAVDNAMATKAANLADYQKSAVAPFLANEDPTKAVARVFAGDGVGKMRELVSRIGTNPDAVDGLKKAVTDYMVGNGGQFINSDGSIKGEMLRNFLRKNDSTLGQLFSGDEMGALGNVARDIGRANLSITGSKIPGGSDTAQNASAVGKFLGTTLGKTVAEGALHGSGLAALFYHGGWPLVIGGILSAGRGATQLGKAAINRTAATALADPAYAGQIMRRVSPPMPPNALTTGPLPAAAGAMRNNLTGSYLEMAPQQ